MRRKCIAIRMALEARGLLLGGKVISEAVCVFCAALIKRCWNCDGKEMIDSTLYGK